jgi:hypothetical protein
MFSEHRDDADVTPRLLPFMAMCGQVLWAGRLPCTPFGLFGRAWRHPADVRQWIGDGMNRPRYRPFAGWISTDQTMILALFMTVGAPIGTARMQAACAHAIAQGCRV